MTLQCECGGDVELVDGSDPDNGPNHWEDYECRQCGRTGTYYFGAGGERFTGCLTSTLEVYSGP